MIKGVRDRNIIRLDAADSTNSYALALGQQGEAAGTVVVAETQTGGRGRLNRSWLSPPGMGLYFSLLLRPDLALENLPKITLAAGLAICKAVETEYGAAPQIKWPNDLLLGGRKFGGILTETSALSGKSSKQRPVVVVGAGLNLFPPQGGFPGDLQDRATALSLHVQGQVSAAALLPLCIVNIEGEVQRLEKGDFPAILAEWSARDAIRDKVLTWVTPKGLKVSGVSLGPDADGVLRIRDEAGTIHSVLSGDLRLVGKIPE